MAKNIKEKGSTTHGKGLWQDDYWLLLMQLYLQKPIGVKPTYSRVLVMLSLELHIPPQALRARMSEIARLDTPRVERIWKEYASSPKRLNRAVSLLREMKGFNSGGDFFEGVAVQETFERNFRPLDTDQRLMPMMLVILLDLYFQLTPATMVTETPEVQSMAKLIRIPAQLVVDVLMTYQYCDPYLNRPEPKDNPLLPPCRQTWQQYGNGDPVQLNHYAEELKEYFK